jgi:hypothetical protein
VEPCNARGVGEAERKGGREGGREGGRMDGRREGGREGERGRWRKGQATIV